MKQIQYLIGGIALFSLVSCTNTGSSSIDTTVDPYNITTLTIRGNGGDDVAVDNGNSGSISGEDINAEAGTLTAGEWNDLNNWTFWETLMQKKSFSEYQEEWQFFPSQRYSVRVTDAMGQPVMDCKVELIGKDKSKLWQAKTNNSGIAELWAQPFSEGKNFKNKIVISYNGKKQQIKSPITFIEGTNNLKLEETATMPENRADVMFVVDATGSMEDEITYLKKELEDVVTQVKTDQPALSLQIGSVFYRDEGDKYVTRSSPLSANMDATINFINDQSADGGGDYPEAVDAALEEAISQQNWSESARTRIVFLMLDAPPHHDIKSLKSIQASIAKAAEKGVKLIPIASSGIDKKTEFLMRFFSLTTNGSYVFMTDHSGVGNGHVEPTIGEYRVEYLNELLTRIITQSTQPSVELVE
ncbi:MAG: hypothetical protein ACI976_002332 [Aureispira sp.]|jgi:hypothetical protein